jgi:hypothetical protein
MLSLEFNSKLRRFFILLIIKASIIREGVPTTMCKCSLRWFFNLDFIKERVENVLSSSTNPNTYTIAISAKLKK